MGCPIFAKLPTHLVRFCPILLDPPSPRKIEHYLCTTPKTFDNLYTQFRSKLCKNILHYILSIFGATCEAHRPSRGVVPGGAPDFGRSVNPISTRGVRLCPPKNTDIPGFSALPTALLCINKPNSSTIRT